ncbi:MAG: GDP-mannose 4,6-dehydratase [Candidatus Diapherotrites archaeon]|uniref:GDP-mannose 4,6-dehydratase n=1 Tax=Candidatus Iainarchaeum sp. TaxID=3101447 RepID=A0A8T3YMD7_9ARCH|nr:GDP-mannose 4,6-dehydratase [Candidatus Diapherotrites archaeon]
MKVLVTGCAGFIGGNFARALDAEGIPFVGVDNFTPSYALWVKKANIKPLLGSKFGKFIKADICAKKLYGKLSREGITHIVHLAARTGVRDSTRVPEEYLGTNILGTLNVLEFARDNNVENVVLASTSSVYGRNELPFSEGQAVSTPMSIYAASKIGMESLAHSFHNVYGVPMTILRLFTVYGPGGRPDMAVYTFTDLISRGEPINIYGSLDSKRDFTFVSDVVDALLLALRRNAGFDVFNIGNSDSRSVGELIGIIEKNVGAKAKKRFVAKAREDVDATLADISKARGQLGYNPKVRLEEGIEKFVQWFNSVQFRGRAGVSRLAKKRA